MNCKNEFSIDILGSRWTVRLQTEAEEKRLAGTSGFTDWTSKLIVIGCMPEDSNLDCPEIYLKKILRHEIIHAYMYESGLGDNWQHEEIGQEETTVDCVEGQAKLECVLNGEMITDE